MALPIDSDWPYFFLNSLSPEAGSTPGPAGAAPGGAGGLPSTDLAFGGQDASAAADLQKSLDAWTNISFNFDGDDQFVVDNFPDPKKPAPTPSSSPAAAGRDLAVEGEQSPSAADLDDLSRHDPRRGVGTVAAKPMEHQFFPGPQEHAFRLPPTSSSGQRRPYRPYDLPHHLSPQHFHSAGAGAPGQIVQPDQLSIATDQVPAGAEAFSGAGQTFSQLLQADSNLASFLGGAAGGPTVSSSAKASGPGPQLAAVDNAAAAAAFSGTAMPVLRPFTAPDGRTVSSLSELLGNADALIAATASSSPALTVGGQNAPVSAAGQAQVVKPGRLSRRATMMGGGEEEDESRGVTPSATARGVDDGLDSMYGDDPDDDEANKRAVEEDKRRRNTAASARFRIKKKLREQAVEKTAQELRERVLELEKDVEGLKKENGWLRNLIVDRAAKDAGSSFPTPAGLDAGPSSGPARPDGFGGEGGDVDPSIPVHPVTSSGRVSKRRRE